MSSEPKRMNRNKCTIKSCRIRNYMQNDKESGVTFFSVPKSMFTKWQALVPCLTKASILCSRHFDEADIIRGQFIGPENKFYPYLRWQLKTGAVPKNWLEESEPPIKKSNSNCTQVEDQPIISKPVKSLQAVNLQDKQQVKKFTKSNDQPLMRTVLQSLSPNQQTSSQMKDLQSVPIANQDAVPPKTVTGEAQVDHDYALPLLRELETTNEIQDLLSQSASSHSNVSVIEGDNTNDESSISHQICSAAEDQVDHDYAMPVQEEEQPVPITNLISHSVLLSSALNVNFTEPVENQVNNTPADVIAPTYVVDEAAFRCFSSYVKLPSQFSWTWSLNKKDNILSCSNFSLSRHGSFIIKTVRIISESSVSLLLNGNTIAPKDLDLSFSTYQELSALIHSFSEKIYCEGIAQPSLKDVQVSDRVSGVKDASGRWRSKHCIYLADSVYKTVDTCSKCKQLKKYLKKRLADVSKKKEDKEKARQKLRMYRRKIQCLEKLDKDKSLEIETWRRDFKKLYAKWNRKTQKELNTKQKASRRKSENPAV